MVFETLHQNTDCVQQSHLGLGQLYLLDEMHESGHDLLGKGQEVLCLKVPVIRHILELSTSGNSDYLVVERVTGIEQVLEDLVDDRAAFLANLDSDPRAEQYGDPSTYDAVAGILLLRLCNQCGG